MNSRNDFEVIKECRVCGYLDVVDVLDLAEAAQRAVP